MTPQGLDGQYVYAAVSTHAYGCGGVEGLDEHARGSGLLWTTPDAPQRIAAVTDRWDTLWLKEPFIASPSPQIRQRLAAAEAIVTDLGGTWPQAPDVQEPKWGPAWQGTRGDFRAAQQAHAATLRHHDEQIAAVLDWARTEVFRAAGAHLVAMVPPWVRYLVHDFGCSCAHGTPSWGAGEATLRTRDGHVYATPVSMTAADFDALLTRAMGEGTTQEARSVERNRAAVKHFDPRRFEVRFGLLDEGREHLTYAQWEAARREYVKDVKVAMDAADYARLSELRTTVGFTNPDSDRDAAIRSVLTKAQVSVLRADEVAELCEVLA